MVDYTRRSIVLGTAGIAAAGAGVTAAASGLSGSVEGQADVQAEQALTVNDVSIHDAGDQDASFTRTSDDNTEFQAAVELNNGDGIRFDVNIENSATDDLDVQVAVDSPDVIDVTVQNRDGGGGSTIISGGDDLDASTDDEVTGDQAVKTGEGTFITTITGGSDGGSSEDVFILGELDDTADPGSYDIGVAINPLSTN